MSDEPDLKLAGLSIWANSREFEESSDFWDGNWLNVRLRVEAPGSQVETTGPWLRIDELAAFSEQLAVLHRDLKGAAELACLEPMLNAKVACGSRGQIHVVIELTPDHLAQYHRFEFAIDQSYLVETLAGCNRLLTRFPRRGAR